jgi:hypothetical protein
VENTKNFWKKRRQIMIIDDLNYLETVVGDVKGSGSSAKASASSSVDRERAFGKAMSIARSSSGISSSFEDSDFLPLGNFSKSEARAFAGLEEAEASGSVEVCQVLRGCM